MCPENVKLQGLRLCALAHDPYRVYVPVLQLDTQLSIYNLDKTLTGWAESLSFYSRFWRANTLGNERFPPRFFRSLLGSGRRCAPAVFFE